jgi:hypothetical protein
MGLFDKGMFVNGDFKGFIQVNKKTKQFKLKGILLPLEYQNLLSYELQENGSTVTKGGIGVGRAVVGGVLFGGAGAVLGGLSKKKTSKEIINKMEIRVSMKESIKNTYYVKIFDKKKVEKGSKEYDKYVKYAENVLSVLDDIASQAQEFPTSPTPDVATQLREFKALLDDGIITQEEFDRKKMELLG